MNSILRWNILATFKIDWANQFNEFMHFWLFPLCVATNRKQAEVGSPDDRGEVGGSQGALCLKEQQQAERKPSSAT